MRVRTQTVVWFTLVAGESRLKYLPTRILIPRTEPLLVVPNLAGVVGVLVIGAGETGTPRGDDAAYFRAVRRSWAELFTAAGARLDTDRHYGYRTQDQLPALLGAAGTHG